MEGGNGCPSLLRASGLGRRHGRGRTRRRRRMLPFATVIVTPPPPPAFTLVVIILSLSLLVELVPLDPRPRVRGPPAALEPPDAQR